MEWADATGRAADCCGVTPFSKSCSAGPCQGSPAKALCSWSAMRRHSEFIKESRLPKRCWPAAWGFRNCADLRRHELPGFDQTVGDLLGQCNHVVGLVLEQPAQDDQLRAQHVAFSDRGHNLARRSLDSVHG